MQKKTIITCVLLLLMLVLGNGCGGPDKKGLEASKEDRIVLGAYTVPKEAYMEGVIPLFQKKWRQETGREVVFETSFVASGAQSRAIAAGFEADVAALSLEGDIDSLVALKMVDPNWKKAPYEAMVSRSLVVAVVRAGNPKQIKDWPDLARSDIEVIYPSPKTSGGAMWVVNAIYGAGLKLAKEDPAKAKEFLKSVQARVKVMDVSGRASVTTFEQGIGDVLLGYENEALLRQKQGKDYQIIHLSPTMIIENPVAMVNRNVSKHGNEQVVKAFVDFLWTQDVQRIFAQYGFRSVLPEVASEFSAKFPNVAGEFDVKYFGGWPKVLSSIFSETGVWTQVVNELAK